jgi:hypothetical protein
MRILDWKGRAHKVAFLIERCASRTCDELACDTHPLQCRSLELDKQETSATEVCVSTFSFFLRAKVGRERWAGKNSNRRGVSFRATWTPTASGSDPRIKQALLLCTCPRLFAGKWIGKGGQGNTQNRGGVSFSLCKLVQVWLFLHPF